MATMKKVVTTADQDFPIFHSRNKLFIESLTLLLVLLRDNLLFYPVIGFFHTILQRDGWFPAKVFLNQGIIAVTTSYSLRGIKVIFPVEFKPGNIFHNVDKLVYGNHFAASKIYRHIDITIHNILYTFDTVINVHKAPGLETIAPDNNIFIAGYAGFDNFPADCCRSFFATTVKSTERPIYVMESGNSRRQAKVFGEMAAHTFAEKLFPAISVFSQSRVGIRFL